MFYTLDQAHSDRPRFVRQTDKCLICHGGSQTSGVPGHVVRSVHADASGQPIFSVGSHRIDHTTPLIKRFGGWFVTGTHGDQQHLGNVTFRQRPAHDGVDDTSGLNVTQVVERSRGEGYRSPHCGPVAGDGRSLRDLDLHTRLFRHACSYLVGSASFAALPTEVRERFGQTIDAVVAGDDDRRFAHLAPADREAIGGILVATNPAASHRMPPEPSSAKAARISVPERAGQPRFRPEQGHLAEAGPHGTLVGFALIPPAAFFKVFP